MDGAADPRKTSRQTGKMKPAGRRVVDRPRRACHAAGVISPSGRLWGTPSP